MSLSIPTPFCHGMSELPAAATARARILSVPSTDMDSAADLLATHLLHGLAYTTGSALGYTPPTTEERLSAFEVPNKAGLSAGARAWSKHFHRSGQSSSDNSDKDTAGWWGVPKGPVALLNERALELVWRVERGASWRNLFWLPHGVLAYEVRVGEGYGMRWAQEMDGVASNRDHSAGMKTQQGEWVLRGFVEPVMEDGHEKGWRH